MDKNQKPTRPPHLRLVVSDELVDLPSDVRDSVQLTLFPDKDPFVLSFFHVGYFKSADMLDIMERFDPGLILDARVLPSFRFLNLDRRIVLNRLSSLGVEYIDVIGLLGRDVFDDFDSGGGDLILFFEEIIRLHVSRDRPFMFLFDRFQVMNQLASEVENKFKPVRERKFKVQVFVGGRENVLR